MDSKRNLKQQGKTSLTDMTLLWGIEDRARLVSRRWVQREAIRSGAWWRTNQAKWGKLLNSSVIKLRNPEFLQTSFTSRLPSNAISFFLPQLAMPSITLLLAHRLPLFLFHYLPHVLQELPPPQFRNWRLGSHSFKGLQLWHTSQRQLGKFKFLPSSYF